MKVDIVQQYAYSCKPVIYDIMSVNPATKESIKDLFGDVGVDIFEKQSTSLVNESKITGKSKFVNNVAALFGLGCQQFEYEKNDNIRAVCMKYLCNHESGLKSDWHEKFGKVGDNIMTSFENIGYII